MRISRTIFVFDDATYIHPEQTDYRRLTMDSEESESPDQTPGSWSTERAVTAAEKKAGLKRFQTDPRQKLTPNVWTSAGVGILVDSEIVLSTRYGKTMVFINKNLINRDLLSTRPYQQRPLINKVDSW